MCDMEQIYRLVRAKRRMLGLSQQELAALAGLRREKVNRFESGMEDIFLSDLARLLRVLGLELRAVEHGQASSGVGMAVERISDKQRQLVPAQLEEAAVLDGSKIKVIDWGRIPG